MTQVKIIKFAHGADLPLPTYATQQAAGADLMAAIDSDITLAPFARMLIPAGIALALPEGFEAQIRPRSGLALKNGITLLNTPGTIDADYRGEIKVLMINLGQEDFVISRGMRIAQLVIAPVAKVQWNQVETLDDTQRSSNGFGSTGVHTDNKSKAEKNEVGNIVVSQLFAGFITALLAGCILGFFSWVVKYNADFAVTQNQVNEMKDKFNAIGVDPEARVSMLENNLENLTKGLNRVEVKADKLTTKADRIIDGAYKK